MRLVRPIRKCRAWLDARSIAAGRLGIPVLKHPILQIIKGLRMGRLMMLIDGCHVDHVKARP